MATPPDKHSPIEHLAGAMAEASSTGVALRELRFLAQVDLRVDPTDARAVDAIAAALGAPLPTRPNTTAGVGPWSSLWLGPDEWLVVGPEGNELRIERVLGAALAGAHGSVVDVSANRTTLELRGPLARDVLAKGCALDLHPRRFRAGACAQTALARAQIVLRQVDDEPLYWILVRCSFAAYLVEWLIDAMAEYRVSHPLDDRGARAAPAASARSVPGR